MNNDINHWVQNYNTIDEVNLNDYSLEFLESEFQKVNISDYYSNIKDSYTTSLINEIKTTLDNIIDNNVIVIRVLYSGIEFEIQLDSEMEFNPFLTSKAIGRIELIHDSFTNVLTNINFKIFSPSFMNIEIQNLDSNYVHFFEHYSKFCLKLNENKDYLNNFFRQLNIKYKNSFINIKKYKDSSEFRSLLKIESFLYNLIKEKKFYNFINSALKDYTHIPSIYGYSSTKIKIIEITTSGKSIKYKLENNDTIITKRVNLFRQYYSI